MRTTVDIDEDLLREAARRYPPGTPKTVLIEEGLRRLVREPAERTPTAPRRLGFFADDGPLVLHESWDDPVVGFAAEPAGPTWQRDR